MKIDRLEPSRHKKGRVLVFLEDGACLKITEQELLDFSLSAGQELDGETLSRLKESAGISNVRAKAAEIVAKSAISRQSLERKLREKGASPMEAAEAAAWLADMGALNDADYAAMLARTCAEKGYGAARIRAKLYEKGVPKALWEAAMAELPASDSQIDAFLSHKLAGARPDQKEKRRLTASLLRRGFDWEEIRLAWKRYGEDMEE